MDRIENLPEPELDEDLLWSNSDDSLDKGVQPWILHRILNCTCKDFQKKYICGHVVALGIHLRVVEPEVRRKAKPGRKKGGRPGNIGFNARLNPQSRKRAADEQLASVVSKKSKLGPDHNQDESQDQDIADFRFKKRSQFWRTVEPFMQTRPTPNYQLRDGESGVVMKNPSGNGRHFSMLNKGGFVQWRVATKKDKLLLSPSQEWHKHFDFEIDMYTCLSNEYFKESREFTVRD